MTDLEAQIRAVFQDVWEKEKGSDAPELTADTLMFNTGLDSMGYAIFVAALEEKLDYDPFMLADPDENPQTFAEFVAFYDKHKPAF